MARPCGCDIGSDSGEEEVRLRVLGIWNHLYFVLCSWGSWVLNTSVLDVVMVTVVREIRGEKRGTQLEVVVMVSQGIKKTWMGGRPGHGAEWGSRKGRGH